MRKSMRYKKYKRKTRKYKGRGKQERSNFLVNFKSNEFTSQLSSKKSVATIQSEGRGAQETQIDKFIRLWSALNEEDIGILQGIIKTQKGFTINAFITLDSANPIIFYAEEYLGKLAEASGRTTKDILQMLTTHETKSQEDMDIIQIAFNDEELHGDKLSESGELLKAKYMSLLP